MTRRRVRPARPATVLRGLRQGTTNPLLKELLDDCGASEDGRMVDEHTFRDAINRANNR